MEKSESAKREEAILKFWKENKIFEKSLEKKSPEGEFIFYEGPPTANAKPALHHLEARAFKDLIPRYKTMRGYHVRRKAGWDTHGLPVELQVEKKLGLNSKKAIEEYGVAKFNRECRESVWEYVGDWNKFTERIGFWVDRENAYVTYHNSYIESVWNIVKEVNKQKLLYKDYKVVPWCPRCGTALSSHELAQGYQDDKDLSVYAKFKVKGQDNTYILAWTTTPWTLPGNLALAVGPKIEYVKVKVGNEFYILAKERLSVLENPEIVEEFVAKDLIGLEYEPLYPFFTELSSADMSKAYKVYEADFVNTEDGTGVVHTAVMYGQDDFVLGTKIGLPKFHLVNPEGNFIKGAGFLENRFVKDEQVAVDIIKDLAHRGLLFKKEKYEHSYPHCWRCKTPLIYYARDSWYIRMSDPKIKRELIAENKKINWEPAHTREGRFGEWLRDIKDWAVSRERYWGTPLPVWICDKCGTKEVVGSLEDLKNKSKKSGNKYFVMRHGTAENNVKSGLHHKEIEQVAKLTEEGRKQVEKNIKKFKEKVDVLISSPLPRAKETTQIVTQALGFSQEKVVYDDRVQEWQTSDVFEGKSKEEFYQYYQQDYANNPKEVLAGGESFAGMVKRVGEFISETEAKYSNKNILIIGHDGATRALSFIVNGLNFEKLATKKDELTILENAEIRKFDYVPLPHNEDYELDLHRPYIDEIKLVCKCGGEMGRTKEVMDVWFDSGAMPFAQDHYPFENKKWVEGKGYPADYISEAIDQTRGWFYTLHAIGVLMGRGRSFKNVICLGHLLDAKGKKMSKSIGNIVDPWEMIEKYGVDTLRLWMYSVNQPGESKNFDEKTVQLLQQQVFGLLYNVLAFYELYRDTRLENNERPRSKNILDQWILARLNELIKTSTESLDNYKLLEPTRALRDFVGDLSTWYLRRSRERIKEGDEGAKATLCYVLKTLAQIMAPFAPFAAEDIWLLLKTNQGEESVHLAKWPSSEKPNSKILTCMELARTVVSLSLEQRQKAQIPVRQPLAGVTVFGFEEINEDEYKEVISEELNVKEVLFSKDEILHVELNTKITPELKMEGEYRELLRAIQDIRKKKNLTPKDVVRISIETGDEGKKLVQKYENDLKKVALASKIEFKETKGEELKIDHLTFIVAISRN
jgi:isoleucyl-tRNA synthetase